ncbi:hypothetical protein [Peribacillus sp. YIM B13482]|uniref:hypothetical protein n=1 Tax=Peribacillus sp. YIM B13482 TaxID=3366298 RepID=UPI003673265A
MNSRVNGVNTSKGHELTSKRLEFTSKWCKLTSKRGEFTSKWGGFTSNGANSRVME